MLSLKNLMKYKNHGGIKKTPCLNPTIKRINQNMKLPTDILENICLRLISKYEPSGIRSIACTLKNIIPLTLSCKELHKVVYDTVYPRLNDMIPNRLSVDIPWDDIIKNPYSVKVKQLQQANKSLENTYSRKNKEQLIQDVYEMFDLSGPSKVPVKIIWQHNSTELLLFFQMDYITKLRAESIIGTLFFMGIEDINIAIISVALSTQWKKNKTDISLNKFLMYHGIYTIKRLEKNIDTLMKQYLPSDWNYKKSRYYIEKVCNTSGHWTIDQIAEMEIRKHDFVPQ